MLFAAIDYLFYRAKLFRYSYKYLQQKLNFALARKDDKEAIARIESLSEEAPLTLFYHPKNSVISWAIMYYTGP